MPAAYVVTGVQYMHALGAARREVGGAGGCKTLSRSLKPQVLEDKCSLDMMFGLEHQIDLAHRTEAVQRSDDDLHTKCAEHSIDLVHHTEAVQRSDDNLHTKEMEHHIDLVHHTEAVQRQLGCKR